MVAKEEQRIERICGIQLPVSEDCQLISQFVDDISFSIIGNKEKL